MSKSPQQLLFSLLAQSPCEPFEIAPRIDARSYLARKFDREFPFLLKQYSFPNYRRMVGQKWMHWHDYYEMILPVSGSGKFQVGDQMAQFNPGDLLVVDNLKLHGMSHLSGPHRSLVIFFPAEAIVTAGGNSSDHAFLAPLCGRPKDSLPLLRSDSDLAGRVYTAITQLAEAFFSSASTLDRYVPCKVGLLTLLGLLREHFGLRHDFQHDLQRRQQRSARLRGVFELLAARYAEPLTQPEVAALAGMSVSRFRDFFKQTTGSTFVEYIRQLRLSKAAEQLKTGHASIAEIAAATGFSDQSYLHRCFKASYGIAPLEFRQQALAQRSENL